MTTEDIDGGTDYVERNAYVLETLLNNLKTRLAPDPATGQPYKYTVIGPSMGGLISRYALAHMERQQQLRADAGQPADPWWDHNTAEWISLDVPHLGANIPLGDQHLLSFFSNVQAAKDNLEQRLNSVAAKQFLVAHYSNPGIGGASGYRDRFMLALRDNGERNSAGYPVRLRRIALANGQLNGLLPGSLDGQPGGTMLDLNVYTRFWSGVASTIISFFGFSYKTTSSTNIATSNSRFLPNSGSSAVIFSGRTNQTKGLNWGIVGVPTKIGAVRVTGGPQGCWDLAPGGLRDTQRQLRNQFEAAGQGQQYKVSVTDVHPNHCFIPTVSALGFQYQNLASYQSTNSLPNPFTNLLGRNLVCAGEIPFDAYYGPTSNNTFHVMSDNNGLLFLSQELARVVATPIFAIFKTALCPNAGATTYSVNPECAASRPGQAQPATTYTWTLGTGLQLISGQGTASVQVQPAPGYMGSSSIQVVATRAGYSASAPLSRTIRIGGPDAPQAVQTDPQGICLNNVANFTITNFDPSVSYTVSPVSRASALPANPTINQFRIKAGGNAPRTGSFNITATACGLSTTVEYYYDFGPCDGPMARQYTISPNPAADEVQVQEESGTASPARSTSAKANASEASRESANKAAGIEMIRIYDNYGQLRLEQACKGVASTRLALQHLPAGLYVMHIFSEGVVASRQQLQVVR